MDYALRLLRQNRNSVLKFIDNFSTEQLNKIPAGFSNNLIWNAAHIVAVQQKFMCLNSGLELRIPDLILKSYDKGTRPERELSAGEIFDIRAFVDETANQASHDYANGKFSGFRSFTTGSGFELRSIDEAIGFNNYHEGMHIGIMMGIRKFL